MLTRDECMVEVRRLLEKYRPEAAKELDLVHLEWHSSDMIPGRNAGYDVNGSDRLLVYDRILKHSTIEIASVFVHELVHRHQWLSGIADLIGSVEEELEAYKEELKFFEEVVEKEKITYHIDNSWYEAYKNGELREAVERTYEPIFANARQWEIIRNLMKAFRED